MDAIARTAGLGVTVAIGNRTTFGMAERSGCQFRVPRIFPVYAELVTRRDNEWHYELVKVIDGNARRFRIRAIKPTVIPGLANPLPPNVSMVVPGYSLQPLHQDEPA